LGKEVANERERGRGGGEVGNGTECRKGERGRKGRESDGEVEGGEGKEGMGRRPRTFLSHFKPCMH